MKKDNYPLGIIFCMKYPIRPIWFPEEVCEKCENFSDCKKAILSDYPSLEYFLKKSEPC